MRGQERSEAAGSPRQRGEPRAAALVHRVREGGDRQAAARRQAAGSQPSLEPAVHLRRFPPDLLALMEAQFGAVARFQLLDHMSEGEVEGLVRRRVLEILQRGVYRVRGAASSPEQTAMAAVLRSRPQAVVTGPLVLALLNVDGFDRGLPFEVLVRPGRRPANVDFAWRRNPTPGGTTAWRGGLPITLPAVALVDSARWLGTVTARQLRVGLDAARWGGLTTTARVLDRAHELGPRDRGARFFLDLLEEGDIEPESEPERELGRVAASFDPAPDPQVWVTPGRRVDWYWRGLRLALEYQGRVDHDHAAGRAADRERDLELEDRGIRVLSLVGDDVREPDALRGWLRVALDRRARELGVPAPKPV